MITLSVELSSKLTLGSAQHLLNQGFGWRHGQHKPDIQSAQRCGFPKADLGSKEQHSGAERAAKRDFSAVHKRTLNDCFQVNMF
jgi:hypothetical protein